MECKRKQADENEKRIMQNLKGFMENLQRDILSECGYSSNLYRKYASAKTHIAQVTGFKKNTVAKYWNKHKNSDIPQGPKRKKNSNRIMHCDTFCVALIRSELLEFYSRKEYPLAEDLFFKCFKNEHFPIISLATFRKWLHFSCKMKFKNINHKPICLDRKDVGTQRNKYLETINELRKNGYQIYFQYDTYNSDFKQSPSESWQILLTKKELHVLKDLWSASPIFQNINTYSGGFVTKNGDGKVIMCLIGNENGFLQGDGVDDIFLSKKDNGNDNTRMNQINFVEWFKNVLKQLPPKSVVVLDQAPHHKEILEETKMAKQYWKVGQIVQNLKLRKVSSQNGSLEELTKTQLIELSNKYPVLPKYTIEQMAEATGKDIKILWVPVAHNVLNPMELIWASIKHNVAIQNKLGEKQTLHLIKDCIQKFSPKLWAVCVNHTRHLEDEMKIKYSIVEDLIEAEPFTFSAMSDCESSSDSSDSD